MNIFTGMLVIISKNVQEKDWWNIRLQKWIKPKYVNRTKYKELKKCYRILSTEKELIMRQETFDKLKMKVINE